MVAGFADTDGGLVMPMGNERLPKDADVVSALKAKGETPAKDDPEWVAALTSVKGALQALRALLDTGDSNVDSGPGQVKLQDALAVVNDASKLLFDLEPSPLAAFENRETLRTLVAQDLKAVMVQHHAYVSRKLKALRRRLQPFTAQATAPRHVRQRRLFTLVDTVTTVAIQGFLSQIRGGYSNLLEEAAWDLVDMTSMLVLHKIIDRAWPPEPQGPSIDMLLQGAQGFFTPGNDFKVLGSNFGAAPGDCSVVFIAPSAAVSARNAVEEALSVAKLSWKSLKTKNPKNSLEAARQLKAAEDIVKGIAGFGNKVAGVFTGIMVMPTLKGSDFGLGMKELNFGYVPKQAYCCSGMLCPPKPAIVIPLCTSTGRGAPRPRHASSRWMPYCSQPFTTTPWIRRSDP